METYALRRMLMYERVPVVQLSAKIRLHTAFSLKLTRLAGPYKLVAFLQ